MADLASWLSSINKACGALLAPLEDDYGVEKVEDLLLLDPDDVKALTDTLRMSGRGSSRHMFSFPHGTCGEFCLARLNLGTGTGMGTGTADVYIGVYRQR